MASTSTEPSRPDVARGNRLWLFAFVTLIVLECAPFWAFRYVPSQDGPSHVYNALVLANYDAEPLYQQYYQPTLLQPAGNMLSQFVLAAFLKVVPPPVAEKLFLTAYVLLLFLSFRYLLVPLTPHFRQFSVLAGLLTPNYFFYLGFWNFCISAPLLLIAIGYYLRHQQRWTLRPLAILTAMGFLVYFTHVVSWSISIAAIALLGLPPLVSALRAQPLREAFAQYLLPLGSLVPPGLLFLLHWTRAREFASCSASTSWRDRLTPIYTLAPLHTLVTADHSLLIKIILTALMLTLLFIVGFAFLRRQLNRSSIPLLVLSLICATVSIAGPDCVRSGGHLRQRIAVYFWLFLIVWLASALPRWPGSALNIVTASWGTLPVIVLIAGIPTLSEWNERLAEVVRTGDTVRPGSSVLMFDLTPSGEPNPYLHAVDLLSPKVMIDLFNYEALTDYFSVQFRPERSPIPPLCSLRQFQASHPVIDIGRYERETQGRVDYLLFSGNGNTCGNEPMDQQVDKLYGNQLTAYSLISARDEHYRCFRLYRRIPPAVSRRQNERPGRKER